MVEFIQNKQINRKAVSHFMRFAFRVSPSQFRDTLDSAFNETNGNSVYSQGAEIQKFENQRHLVTKLGTKIKKLKLAPSSGQN